LEEVHLVTRGVAVPRLWHMAWRLQDLCSCLPEHIPVLWDKTTPGLEPNRNGVELGMRKETPRRIGNLPLNLRQPGLDVLYYGEPFGGHES